MYYLNLVFDCISLWSSLFHLSYNHGLKDDSVRTTLLIELFINYSSVHLYVLIIRQELFEINI